MIILIIPEMNIIDVFQFNLTSSSLSFIEKDSWAYQGIIYLRWMLHGINICYFILNLFLTINNFFFQINDAY